MTGDLNSRKKRRSAYLMLPDVLSRLTQKPSVLDKVILPSS